MLSNDNQLLYIYLWKNEVILVNGYLFSQAKGFKNKFF